MSYTHDALTLGLRLVQLGITPIYHMREVAINKHGSLWIEAMDAKFEGVRDSRSWNREDFDRILAGFEVRETNPPPATRSDRDVC